MRLVSTYFRRQQSRADRILKHIPHFPPSQDLKPSTMQMHAADTPEDPNERVGLAAKAQTMDSN